MSVEPARHQGLRGSRGDRSACRGHQRHHECDRQRRFGDAGDSTRGLGCDPEDQPRPQGGVAEVAEITTMYAFTYHRASGLRQASNMLEKLEEPKLLAGRQTLLPTMKPPLASPADIIPLAPIQGRA